ncbi:MAG: FAD-dependent oxidoreductase [Chloroflexi bacterium CFX1]|nr:FAD-dependent oxidoreductase [Chloroflexi bacterium CFX1]
MNTYDIAIIGAGAVGCAIARELSRYDLKIALLEANPDVGMGTSKASTAIWHTGYDAKPGSLEAKLLRRSYALMKEYMPEANIAHEVLGGLLIAWNQEQFETLPKLLKQAHDNGETDVRIVSAEEIYQREPHINQGALGGLFVPGEGILCTFSVPLAMAYQAVENGAELFLDFQVKGIRRQTADDGRWSIVNGQSHRDASLSSIVESRYVVNAAGLFSDEINAQFGKTNFRVVPRRGQLIVFDKMARPLVNHVLLPVPTSVTKGVLISPTVYGNILLGPTAEDLNDKSATETTEDGLKFLLEKGKQILPQLLDEEVTATYSGLRAATEHSDYQIEMDAEKRYLCLGGIRSTGISGAMGIAEYGVELLKDAGLELKLKDEFRTVRLPTIGQAFTRPHQNPDLIAVNPAYGEMVCHCERVSRGELIDAMNAPIPATTLDGLRRRTRASQGRCQGFNCHASLISSLRGGAERRRSNPITVTEIASDKSKSVLAMTYDVLIVGAGPAGLSAAIELKKQGINNILVVDREPEAGGMPRFCHHTGFGRFNHREHRGHGENLRIYFAGRAGTSKSAGGAAGDRRERTPAGSSVDSGEKAAGDFHNRVAAEIFVRGTFTGRKTSGHRRRGTGQPFGVDVADGRGNKMRDDGHGRNQSPDRIPLRGDEMGAGRYHFKNAHRNEYSNIQYLWSETG